MAVNTAKKLNFTMKVYDETRNMFVPVYVAPEATSVIKGDVTLSDATNGTSGAEDGIAATPKAVKTVQDNAESKLSKTLTTSQTVAGPVTFSSLVTGTKGFSGNLTGNADTATKLSSNRTITITSTSGDSKMTSTALNTDFGTDKTNSIELPSIHASKILWNYNNEDFKIPINSIPEGAIEKIVQYDTLKAATEAYNAVTDTTKKPFQIGDTIQTSDKTMYIVKSNPPTDSSNTSCYEEYFAGTAAKLSCQNVGTGSKPVYFSNGSPVVASSISLPLGQATTESDGSEKVTLYNTSLVHPVYFKNGYPVETKKISVKNTGSAVYSTKLISSVPDSWDPTDPTAPTTAYNVGSSTTPVYFADGIPKVCSGGFVSVTSSTATAPTDSNASVWILV